jgi:preprotein translocase subunit SecB
MTDLPPQPDSGAAPEPAIDNRPQFRALAQYVRDMSFENPAAPASLRPGLPAPQIQLNIDLGARKIDADTEEVTLRLRATAKRGEETVFIAELLYAGLFGFLNISEADRQTLVAVECPRLMFPFARQVLADMTRDGGFVAVMLEPIDFAGLYRSRQLRQQQGGDPLTPAGPEGGGAPN